MIDHIMKCQKCGLCKNQNPLLDKKRECQVIWVGLSAKKVETDNEIPLSPETNTGMLIKKVEELCRDVTTYKTNLVKCLPLTKEQKLRYPNKKEIDSCFENLIGEINELKPKIVFLLGEKVYSSVGKYLNIQFEKWNDFDYCYKEYKQTYYVPVQHPSFIYVYKHKRMDEYVRGIEKMIHELL
jgi:DNA polymerase